MEEALLERMRAHPAAKQQQVSKPSNDEPVVGKQASGGAKVLSKRAQASRRAAAIRLQTAHRGIVARRWLVDALERKQEEERVAAARKAKAATDRETRRQARKEAAAAKKLQSSVRGRWGRIRAEALKTNRLATIAKQARSNAILTERLLSIQVAVHTAILDASCPLEAHRINEVWIVAELAGGDLFTSYTSRVQVPPLVGLVGSGSRRVTFDAQPASLPLHGASARELSSLMQSSDLSDADLIFSLFGQSEGVASSQQQPIYLGEAYVNLQELLRSKADVTQEMPLTLIGASEDVEIGTLAVSVSAVDALAKMLAAAGVALPGPERDPSPRSPALRPSAAKTT